MTSTADAATRLRFADLTFDAGQHRVWRGAQEIRLTPKSFALLRALAERAPNLVTHTELVDAVWGPRRVVTPENLSQHVTQLRRALEDSASTPRYVEVVRGRGYRLLPQVVDVTSSDTIGRELDGRADRRRVVPAIAIASLVCVTAVWTIAVRLHRQPATVADEVALYGIGTDNAAAFDLALRARGLLDAGGLENLLQAEARLREALALDRNFIGALGLLHKTLGFIRFAAPERAARAELEQQRIVATILSLDPDSAIGNVLRGVERWYAGDLVDAERRFRRARAAAEQGEVLREAERLCGIVERTTGRYAEGLSHLVAAQRNDPLALEVSTHLQMALYVAGRLAAAEREYDRSRDLAGDRGEVELLALMRAVVEGYDSEVVDQRLTRFREAVPSLDIDFAKVIADRDSGLEILHGELARGEAPALPIAWFADYYGDTSLALDAMRRWFEATGLPDPSIWTPFFAHARAAPGFKQLIEDYGIPAYWQATGDWGDFCRPLSDGSYECR
jgi:DNA-binding winged helix-turn-helix (wHTH) protein/tetratricopeptide (TPR) repeat protein